MLIISRYQLLFVSRAVRTAARWETYQPSGVNLSTMSITFRALASGSFSR